MASTLLSSREESLTHYDVLGVSPTCTTQDIEEAFQSLISGLGDSDDEWEQFQQIEAAHHALIDPERRRRYDAAIARDAAQAPPSDPPAQESALPGPAFIGDSDSTDQVPEAHILPAPDVPVEPGSEPSAETNLPAEDPSDELEPRGASRRSRFTLPLIGIVAVVAAGWAAQSLFDGSPNGAPSKVRSENPAAVPTPNNSTPPMTSELPTAQTSNQGAENIFPPMPPELAPPPSTDRNAGQLAGPADSGQVPAASVAAGTPTQADVSSQAGIAPAKGPATTAKPSGPPAASTPMAQAPGPPAAPLQREVASPPGARVEATPPRWISGGLRDSDNEGGRYQGTVGVQIKVGPNGRAGACRVTQSSGNAGLDALTCELVQQRLQFTSARDASGRPIESEVRSTYTWGRKVRQ